MIGHEGIEIQANIIAGDALGQGGQEASPVGVIAKQEATFIAPEGDVVNRAFIHQPGFPRHACVYTPGRLASQGNLIFKGCPRKGFSDCVHRTTDDVRCIHSRKTLRGTHGAEHMAAMLATNFAAMCGGGTGERPTGANTATGARQRAGSRGYGWDSTY